MYNLYSLYFCKGENMGNRIKRFFSFLILLVITAACLNSGVETGFSFEGFSEYGQSEFQSQSYNNCQSSVPLEISLGELIPSSRMLIVDIPANVNVSANEIKNALQEQYGNSFFTVSNIEKRTLLLIPPNSYEKLTYNLVENRIKGIIDFSNGKKTEQIFYDLLINADVFLISTEDLGCSSAEVKVDVTQEQLGSYSLSNTQMGSLSLSYPILISPDNSTLITLSLQTIGKLPKVEPLPSIVALPTGIAVENGEFGYFSYELLVGPEMRAELTSPTFDIEPEFAEPKKKNDMSGSNLVQWSWSVKAPETRGSQIFVLKIYLDDAKEPIFLRGFEVEVASPTEIPTSTPLPPTSTFTPTFTPVIPTPTPIPVIQRIGNRMIDNFEIVLGALLVFIASVAGIYFQYIRPLKKKAKTKSKK